MQTKHTLEVGPGFKWMSPDSNYANLKNESQFLILIFDKALNLIMRDVQMLMRDVDFLIYFEIVLKLMNY